MRTELSRAPATTRLVFRQRYRSEHLLGMRMPAFVGEVESGERATIAQLGPDEWLILSDETADALATAIAFESADAPYSLVDISAREVRLVVEGPAAADVIASGCPLDTDLAVFPHGSAYRTLFHKSEILLWRSAPDLFLIDVWRSFAPYVEALLKEAIRNETALACHTAH